MADNVQRDGLIEDILRIYGYTTSKYPRASVRRFPMRPNPTATA